MSPAAKMTREELRAQAVEYDLDEAYEIRQKQEDLNKLKSANRSALQNALSMGYANEKQAGEILELFPDRERATPEQRIEKLREQLSKAEEKAAKQATNGTTPVDEAVTA